jgi:pantoate--beta-alanine ligase
MKIISDINEMQTFAVNLRQEKKTISFVPTMGFLHEGHLSLMRIARPKCDVLVVSIFVNPTQFGPSEDFDKYPRNFEQDEKFCRSENVDIIFYPSKETMYSDPYHTFVNVSALSETMCGLSRPGHFQGVATVVAKLFNIVKPHLAIFGQKDYQQALIIRQMVNDLNFDTEILTGPIVREADGLAMSSRNKYLSPEEREKARSLFKSLQLAAKLVREGKYDAAFISDQIRELLQQTGGILIDYVAIVDGRNLQPVEKIGNNTLIALAAKIGGTRLIDNILIQTQSP